MSVVLELSALGFRCTRIDSHTWAKLPRTVPESHEAPSASRRSAAVSAGMCAAVNEASTGGGSAEADGDAGALPVAVAPSSTCFFFVVGVVAVFVVTAARDGERSECDGSLETPGGGGDGDAGSSTSGEESVGSLDVSSVSYAAAADRCH